MKVLITNAELGRRGGTQLYVRDLAVQLLKRGHTPIIYSTALGEIAHQLRAETIPVVDTLDAISVVPDIIHGHHHMETMTALLHFPGVPAIYVCHDWFNPADHPPRFPRIRRYVAVDEVCHDRFVSEAGVPEEQTRLILSFVDLERFVPREPLPTRPARALLLSNYAEKGSELEAVRSACRQAGVSLDVVGRMMGNAADRPERLLRQYDLVFAAGRSALEALAVGCAVIIYFWKRIGPMVASAELDRLLRWNLGSRAMGWEIPAEAIEAEVVKRIQRYDAADAGLVTRSVRARAGLDKAADEFLALYAEVIAEQQREPSDPAEEARAAARYIGDVVAVLQRERETLSNSGTARVQRRLARSPALHAIAGWLSRRAARWLP